MYNNNTYITGPRRNELERATGRPVKQLSISNSGRADRSRLRGDKLSIYRPNIAESRPLATERPRQFRAAEHPINASTPERSTPIDRNVIHQTARDRNQVIPQERVPVSTDRPAFNGADAQRPAIDRRQDRMPMQQTDRQPIRTVETTPQPRQQQRDWNNSNRFPERTTIQQPQQRIERAPINRSMESPRVQQVQPAAPQRMERPVVEQRQPAVQQQPRVESRRMEAPREMPQRQMPAAQPTQDRPGAGGEGGRSMR